MTAWAAPVIARTSCRRATFTPSPTLLQLLNDADSSDRPPLRRRLKRLQTRCLSRLRHKAWAAEAAATSAQLHVDATHLELVHACRHGSVSIKAPGGGTAVLTARRMRGARDHVFTILADRA